MTLFNRLSIIGFGLVAMGWVGRLHAQDDVTIVSPPTTAQSTTQNGNSTGGTGATHKLSHKKKHLKTASTTAAATSSAVKSATATATTTTNHSVAAQASSASSPVTHPASSAPTAITYGTPQADPALSSLTPAVETGLPIPRHGTDNANGYSPVPIGATLPGATSQKKMAQSQDALANAPLLPLFPGATASGLGSYTSPEQAKSPSDAFVFASLTNKHKNIYPWKKEIITTEFWIGEPGCSISPTDNVASAWDQNWRDSNRGTDSPYNRSGYATADHAATVNPFYVALPFNDLAYPDKAREWLPPGWHREPRDGRPVSACKDRWVEIKNRQGEYCYAQWEDVGPLVSDHAEYVFGDERPDTLTRAGLDVSPAVAQYLHIDGDNRYTSWRFVDDEDVPPGLWLKYDEEALLFTAIHEMKNKMPDTSVPVQQLSEPVDDASSLDSNKKKVGAAKG
jgi:hypothetical protein